MPNYKTGWAQTQLAGFHGTIYPFDPLLTKLLWLHHTDSTGSAYRSLEEHVTGNDYQVPVGKKFIILYVSTVTDPSSDNFLFYTSAADVATGAVAIVDPPFLDYVRTKSFYSEVPAGQYITNFEPSSETWILALYGVEVDA